MSATSTCQGNGYRIRHNPCIIVLTNRNDLNVTDAQTTQPANDDSGPSTSSTQLTNHGATRPGNAGGGAVKLLLVCALLATLAILTANIVILNRQLVQSQSQNRERMFYVVCDDNSSAVDRADSFLKLVQMGHAEWRSALLNKTDLRGARVTNASLQFLAMTDADLRKANFSKTDLHSANLALSDATEANFGDVDLSEANLFKTILSQADLRSAILSGASLSQATVHDANMVLCDLTECDLLMCDLAGSNLAGADFTGANLESAVLTGCNLALTRLDGANLIDADLTDANWWRARGLTGDQQLELLAKYSPSSDDKDRLNDFNLWMNSQEK